MTSLTTGATHLPTIGHEDAMGMAGVEYARLFDLVDQLTEEDWSRPTDCTEWDVKAIVGHLVGMFERNADPAEGMRQAKAAAAIAEQKGCFRIDAMTGLQVQEHAHMTPAELRQALRGAAARSLAGRTATTAEVRSTPYVTGLPGEGDWTIGYLLDVIHTRDPWIHRVDISRAVGRDMVLTPGHDGRLIACVVEEWGRRHGQPYRLLLDGPAGGTFVAGDGAPELRLDAVEFCRILSGRGSGDGLLTTRVPF